MYKLEWNLHDLFENNQLFYSEIANGEKLVKEVQGYKNIELDATTLLDLLNKEWEIKEKVNNILIYGSLKYYKKCFEALGRGKFTSC